VAQLDQYSGAPSIFLTNTTVLAANLRFLQSTSDLGALVTRSSAIEKLSASKLRITIGASNPFITAPGGGCATSTTVMTFAIELPQGRIIFGHAGATPNNKIGMISPGGYVGTSDCLASQAAPVTTALPTAALRHPSGKLIVAYGSTTFSSNQIWSYTVNETTPSITGGTAIINLPGAVNGPSAMAVDDDTGDLYVASATANAESIEKFNYNSTTGAFTRAGISAFIPKSEYLKCVSGLLIVSE
jgi:hypothetical protein